MSHNYFNSHGNASKRTSFEKEIGTYRITKRKIDRIVMFFYKLQKEKISVWLLVQKHGEIKCAHGLISREITFFLNGNGCFSATKHQFFPRGTNQLVPRGLATLGLQ